MALLSIAVLLLPAGMDGYPSGFGMGAIVFMALNALAAVYPLYRFKGQGNPLNVYMLGMMIRMGIIGAALVLVITLGGLSRNALLAFTLTAMFSFIAYLAVEIHHFIRNNASLMGQT